VLGAVDRDGVVDREHRQQHDGGEKAEADAEQPRRAGTHNDARSVDDVPLGMDEQRAREDERERQRESVARHASVRDGDDRRHQHREDVGGQQRARPDHEQANQLVDAEAERREHDAGGDQNRQDVDDAVGGVGRVLDGAVAGGFKRLDERQRADLHENEQRDGRGTRGVGPLSGGHRFISG